MPARGNNSNAGGEPPLTKRQRQALRIHRPPLSVSAEASPAPSLVPSPATSPPEERGAIPRRVAGRDKEKEKEARGRAQEEGRAREAREQREREREERDSERERASPSKYPTPLPDEDDDEVPEGAISISRPVALNLQLEYEPDMEMEMEMGETLLPARDDIPAPAAGPVPVGALVDVEEEEAPLPVQTGRDIARKRQEEVLRATEAREKERERERQREREENQRSAARRKTRRASMPQAQAHATQPVQQHAQSHTRTPEAPRAPPPRALSALSHTLRALEAVTSTATSAYGTAASAYSSATSAYGSVTGARRAPMHAPPPAHFAAVHRQGYALGPGEGESYGGRAGTGAAGGGDDEEAILGARWDEVVVGARTTRLLTLTYAGGVQLWDASALGGVAEVLNLRVPASPTVSPSGPVTLSSGPHTPSASSLSALAEESVEKPKDEDGDSPIGMHGPILGAAVLPPVLGTRGKEEAGLQMGILSPHALYVYSLALGRVVGTWSPPTQSTAPDPRRRRDGEEEQEKGLGTPSVFEATGKVIVVTTHSPPALVVLGRSSLRALHVILASALATPALSAVSYGHPSGTSYSSTGSSPPYGSPTPSNMHPVPVYQPPSPVFAIHGRLLAFLAAPAAAPPPELDGARGSDTWGRTLGSSIGRFFSRSAPAAAGALATSAAGLFPAASGAAALASVSSALAGGGGGAGAWVRVVDLGAGLRDVHAFQAGRAPVGALAFGQDGTRVFVVRRDGLGAGVWGLRPGVGGDPSAPAQLYELRRGRTGAVVEGVAGAWDGRFVALATRRRTVHVFAVNPYGGRADVRSHLGARVRDGEGVGARVGGAEEAPTEVHALVRMRLPAAPHGEDAQPPAPLAVAFVPPAAPTMPLRSPRSPASPASPTSAGPQSGVQDVLVFDPADGVLSLRRVTIALEAPHGAGLPISVSLPTGRLMGTSMSTSPPAYATSYARGHQHLRSAAAEAAHGTDLGGREAVVATWSLRRRRGWAEIRKAKFADTAVEKGLEIPSVKQDWLSQAELSTFSSAPRVLPRCIYLSHQFSFHTLGEDYHALIRRYQFAVGGAKIDVRREVEVSAFAQGPGGEAFVEGYSYASSPREIRRRSRNSASFDEPLASALAGDAHYARPPPVLPMLPNGSPASFRSSMPVRAVAGLGDGVAEGLGRLRREMRAQRQRQLAARSPRVKGGDDVEASVPLEFDEEDEDFALPPQAQGEAPFLQVHADREDDDALSAGTSRNGESVASVSTPATSAHALDEERGEFELDVGARGDGESGEWAGWGAEDARAVEEAETFDDISVVGLLDEEQAAVRAEVERRKGVAVANQRSKNRKKRA
ncbi:hypothetical protein B0H15DRAFT_872223 [Mycena belliarum]|uniref:BCAS3 WD40 domain-containing protein n=1 Tax=Mycena belliarum TaxID=1033014 RepID=A0AAD6XHN4_9AGAR|nr:hypothetical protein B0H15DRAFT_872223 [Mycena belliae]